MGSALKGALHAVGVGKNSDSRSIFGFIACCQCRMTTCLENLEMSGNLTAVREMSGKNLVRDSCLKLFIVNCIFACMQVFTRSLFCVKY